MPATNLPTDFQDDFTAEDETPQITPPAAKDADGVPYCRLHHCRMKRVSGGKKGSPTVYYQCPVEGCQCKAQMIRTKRESVVPPNPVCCPKCSTEQDPVICERSERHSRSTAVVVQCPKCNWKSNMMPVPMLVVQHFAARERSRHVDSGGIGDR